MLYIVRLLSKNAHFQAYFDFPPRNIDFQVKFIFQPEISDFWLKFACGQQITQLKPGV